MTYVEVEAEAVLMNKYDEAFDRYKNCLTNVRN